MDMSFAFPVSLRENLTKAKIDFGNDVFKMLLMQPLFSFNPASYLSYLNVIGTTGAVNYTIAKATATITWAGGDFIAAGFVAGNRITMNGTNNGEYVVYSVGTTTMKIMVAAGSTLVNETATGKIIRCVDEMATGGGYTAGAGGVVVTFTAGRSGLVLNADFDWADFGSNLATSPGGLIYDASPITSATKLVVAYAAFSPSAEWLLNF